MTTHEFYMKRCIELAKNGLGTTYPNPLVGSVIVHKGKIIGEGWHKKAGEPHAEVNAVNSVKDKGALLNTEDLAILSELLNDLSRDVLGLKDDKADSANVDILAGVVEMVLEMRRDAKMNRDFATSDLIRQKLTDLGIQIKDTKEGTDWNLN